MQGPGGNAFAYDSFVRVNPSKKRKRKDKGNASTSPCDLLTRAREGLETDIRGGWSLGCKGTYCGYWARGALPLRFFFLDARNIPQGTR